MYIHMYMPFAYLKNRNPKGILATQHGQGEYLSLKVYKPFLLRHHLNFRFATLLLNAKRMECKSERLMSCNCNSCMC